MTILTGIGCSLNPTDRVEAGLMLFMLVGGVFAYAVILGNVYSIMQNVGQDERDFRKHIESLMNFLDYRQVKDRDLKQKIVGHFNRTWQKSKGIEEDAMLRSLGRPLRLEVLNNLNAAILDKIPCLANLNNLQKSLFCDNLMSHYLQKGDALIVTGEEVRLLYFVMKGRVLLFSQSDERHLSEGYVIGMDELLTNQSTFGYSVVALEDDTQVCTHQLHMTCSWAYKDTKDTCNTASTTDAFLRPHSANSSSRPSSTTLLSTASPGAWLSTGANADTSDESAASNVGAKASSSSSKQP